MEWSLKRNKMQDENGEVDDEVMVQAAKVDRSAFAQIYQRYVNRVYRYIYRRVGNERDAEDLTAQVFEDALHSLSHYHPQGRFAGWLFSLAYRRCVDYFRRPKFSTLREEIVAREVDPLEQLVDGEKREGLERLLLDLKEDDLELLRLRFSAQLTYAEMALVLHRNEGAVKMAMSRLLKKLNDQWEAENEGN